MFKQICIVGAGPVGLTLANCLVRSPFIKSVAIIDKKLPPILENPSQIPHQRVYSVNRTNINLLTNLDIKKHIRQYGLMQNISVISKQSEQGIFWSNNHAQVIQNNELVSAMMLQLKNYEDKIQFIESELKQYKIKDHHCQIKLENGQQIDSNLLVGSDGNKSKVKSIAKIETYGWSYRQNGIVCTLQLDNQTQNNTAYQIYYEGNTLAVLPLWKNYVSIVWSLNYPEYQHLMKQNEQFFVQIINNILENSGKYSKGNFPNIKKIINKRLAFPLQTLQAGRYTAERLALIGDAAHTIHPMAGMGVNSGMHDAVFLANNIIKNKKTGNDIGNQIALNQFEVQSKKLNYSNSLVMQAIKNIFQCNNPVVNFGRKLGLKSVGMDLLKDNLQKMAESHPFAENEGYQWEAI